MREVTMAPRSTLATACTNAMPSRRAFTKLEEATKGAVLGFRAHGRCVLFHAGQAEGRHGGGRHDDALLGRQHPERRRDGLLDVDLLASSRRDGLPRESQKEGVLVGGLFNGLPDAGLQDG